MNRCRPVFLAGGAAVSGNDTAFQGWTVSAMFDLDIAMIGSVKIPHAGHRGRHADLV